jgi:hypothetical protein
MSRIKDMPDCLERLQITKFVILGVIRIPPQRKIFEPLYERLFAPAFERLHELETADAQRPLESRLCGRKYQ